MVKEDKENPICENYKNIREELIKEGYKEEISYISVLKANILAFLTAGPFALLILFAYSIVWKEYYFEVKSLYSIIWLWTLFIISIPIHEFLHGFAWQFFCTERWKSIKFGVLWSKLTPYCHCKEPLSVNKYLVALLMPFFVLGLGIGIISIVLRSPLILIVSLLNILSAGGDTTIALKIFKYRKKKDTIILDHPTEIGFVVFEK
jgi:hypothetical protein